MYNEFKDIKLPINKEQEEFVKSITKMDRLLKKIELEKNNLREQIKKSHISCINCNHKVAIGEIEYVQDYWYESPWGCTGGDHWHTSNEIFRKCPKCESIIRIYGENNPILRFVPYMKGEIGKSRNGGGYNCREDLQKIFGTNQWIQ